VKVQNSKDLDVVLDVRRNSAGDWSLQTAASFVHHMIIQPASNGCAARFHSRHG
jgi:hypothetical protein